MNKAHRIVINFECSQYYLGEPVSKGETMYKCEKHGELTNSWCEECHECKKCDCRNTDTNRYKDMYLECEEGTKTFTIYVEYCETCGEIIGINW